MVRLGLSVAPERELRYEGGGVWSDIAPEQQAAPYDRHAQVYDRLVGSRFYNRAVWGVSTSEYAAFAAEAVQDGQGPFLDVGCGTAVFSAGVYRSANRPLVLVDRSLPMLRRAATRLDGASATLIQAGLEDLPFPRASFETVACFATLHVLEDTWRALELLRAQMAPDGRLYVSMLVLGGLWSRRYLRMLHRRGEVGTPRHVEELRRAAADMFADVDVRRTGAMAWLRASCTEP